MLISAALEVLVAGYFSISEGARLAVSLFTVFMSIAPVYKGLVTVFKAISGMAFVQLSFNFWLRVQHRHMFLLNFQRDLPKIKYLQISCGSAVDELQ